MHCPKCGANMIPKNNSMYCERGNMLLPKTLYGRFNARFIEKIVEEPLLRRTQSPRGRYFCPACGQRMKFFDGYMQCPAGHGSLNDAIFDLNQLCPHDRADERASAHKEH